jgi:hypothetical protein
MAGPTAYQSVGATASTYDTSPATDFPNFFKLDGVDGGFATAAFAAGTLGADMTLMVPIRRESAADFILASKTITSDPTIAVCVAGSGLTATTACGATVTHTVDGVAVPGGFATTRAQLNTAITVGSWHILEIKNLDLSTFTSLTVGKCWAGYYFNGGIGEILLCETPSAAVLTQMRQYLASQYSITL